MTCAIAPTAAGPVHAPPLTAVSQMAGGRGPVIARGTVEVAPVEGARLLVLHIARRIEAMVASVRGSTWKGHPIRERPLTSRYRAVRLDREGCRRRRWRAKRTGSLSIMWNERGTRAVPQGWVLGTKFCGLTMWAEAA